MPVKIEKTHAKAETNGSTGPKRPPRRGKLPTEAPKVTTPSEVAPEAPSPKPNRDPKPKASVPAVIEKKGQQLSESLTDSERDRYIELNAMIAQGMDAFVEVGLAILEVRDSKLYREEFATFEDYCKVRWSFTARRATQLVSSVQVVKGLAQEGVTDLPRTDAQAMPLVSVPKGKRAEVWQEAQETAKKEGRKSPRRQDVAKAASKVTGKPAPEVKTKLDKKIAKGLQEGTIPGDATIEGQTPEAPAESPVDIETPDAEWLDKFSIRSTLSDSCRDIFDAEALAYRWITPHRLTLARGIKPILKDAIDKAKRTGPYVGRLLYALRTADPSRWTQCPSCTGTGQVPTIGKCADCHGAGYKVG
jgi:hypothetical protein